MQRIAIGISILLLAGALYHFASPRVAVTGLGEAITEGDSIELGDRVDFPRVREGLKAQVNALVLGASHEKLASNPFGAFAIGLASNLLEGVIDSYLTSTGLAALASGRKPGDHPRSPDVSNDPSTPENADRPFARARLDRESLDRFSAWVPTEMGQDIRFVFRRYGLAWTLTDIVLPASQ